MTSNLLARRAAGLTLVTVVALACGDDGPSGSSGSITLTLNPATLSVPRGGSGSVAASLARSGGFDGAVSLAIAGLPAGVSATITPPLLTEAATAATVEVTVGAAVPLGTYTATVTSTGEGVAQAAATLQLTVTAAPDYALTASPTALTVPQGGIGNVTVNIDRTNFTGAVALTLANAPNGISAVFTPTPVTGNMSSLAVSVAANASPGSYPLTIQGSATGPGVRTTTLTVTVPAPASYTIALAPASLSVQPGGRAAVNVTLTRTNFAGVVNLAFENAPPGVTGTLAPSSTTGNMSVFTIDVGAAVPAGLHELTLRATATGLADRSAIVQLTVTGPSGGTPVEFLFCDPSRAPVFFAYQDGTGAWQSVPAVGFGGTSRFAFTLSQSRGGILAVFEASAPLMVDGVSDRTSQRRASTLLPGRRAAQRARAGAGATVGRPPHRVSRAEGYLTEVLLGSATELAEEGAGMCAATRPLRTVTGTVQGVPEGSFGVVSLGWSTIYVDEETENPVTFPDVPGGIVDLVASRVTGPGSAPNRVLIFRNLDVADGGTVPTTVDFNGPASSAPDTAMATITGGANEYLEAYAEVVTGNGVSLLWFDLDPSPVATRPWGGLPTSSMTSGDLHGLVVFATPEIGSAEYRVTAKYVGAVSNQTVALGPLLDPPTTTSVSAGTYPRFRFQGTLPSAYDKGAAVDIVNVESSGNVYSLYATRSYLGGGTGAYDLTMPEVSTVAGFPAAARLTPGQNEAYVGGYGFTGVGVYEPVPTLGGEFRAVAKRVLIQVP